MIRKTVIITGASGGIGSATALKFAQEGYDVALVYFTHSTEKLEQEIKSMGVDSFSVCMNIRDEESVKAGFKAIFEKFKTVDAVICNAGVAESEKLLIDRSLSDIDYILETNLRGTILCNRETVKFFLPTRSGVIVNVSSILGKVGSACEVVYSASKAGIIGLTKALSKEVGGFGIRVNAVAPGMIDTNMTKNFTKEEKAALAENTTLGRIGKPEEVADVIYFLASEKSRFITGECIEVSGGLLI